MAAVTGVYKITSPSSKIYIGSSANINKRWKDYLCLNCKTQKRLFNSLKKYGAKNHTFEIVETCTLENILEREAFWGHKLKTLSRNKGLNLRLPKSGESYYSFSKESRNKMSLSSIGIEPWNKGIPQKEEVKNKISNTLKGKKPWNKGKYFSKKTKEKMSISSKGQVAWNKKIVIDLSTGIFYESIREASNIFEIKRTTLQSMLSGVNKNKTNLKTV